MAAIQGQRWQQDSNTADELIWSVLPKQTAEERKRLAGLASSLLGRIGAGLDAIGVSAEERRLLSQHLVRPADQRLAQPAPQRQRAHPRSSASRNGASPTAEPCLLERHGQQRPLSARTPAGSKIAPRAPAGRWATGCVSWFRRRNPMCGLCCWQSPASGMVLLFNPDWGYAVAMPRSCTRSAATLGPCAGSFRVSPFSTRPQNARSSASSTADFSCRNPTPRTGAAKPAQAPVVQSMYNSSLCN
jgi:hypothetical protein